MKMCVAFLGALLLALHLSSQMVQAQLETAAPMNTTKLNATMMPTTNSPMNMTSKDKNGSERIDALTLLLPLALAASLLHSWS